MAKSKDIRQGYGKLLDAWVAPEGAGDPIGCIATSFTFSPVFFEEECLGRFLSLETNPNEDGPVYLVEREEKPPPPENPMSADRVRWEHIQRVFELCDRNVSETARRLNMHRRTLQRILAKRSPR